MTGEQLYRLLGEVDDKLIADADMKVPQRAKRPKLVDMKAPRRTKRPWFAAIAAAAACVVVLIFIFMPHKASDSILNDSQSQYEGAAGSNSQTSDVEDMPQMEDNDNTASAEEWLDCTVIESDGNIVVAPDTDSPYFGLADRFVLDMTEYTTSWGEMPPDLTVGEHVRVVLDADCIVYNDDGSAQVQTVFDIYKLSEDENN